MDLNRLLAYHGRNGVPVQALTSDSLARFMNSPDARLAPHGREPSELSLTKLSEPLPTSWADRRAKFGFAPMAEQN
jgi:hypothetical protein